MCLQSYNTCDDFPRVDNPRLWQTLESVVQSLDLLVLKPHGAAGCVIASASFASETYEFFGQPLGYIVHSLNGLINPPSKVCCSCLIRMPLDAFGPDPGMSDGRRSNCRKCESIRVYRIKHGHNKRPPPKPRVHIKILR